MSSKNRYAALMPPEPIPTDPDAKGPAAVPEFQTEGLRLSDGLAGKSPCMGGVMSERLLGGRSGGYIGRSFHSRAGRMRQGSRSILDDPARSIVGASAERFRSS